MDTIKTENLIDLIRLFLEKQVVSGIHGPVGKKPGASDSEVPLGLAVDKAVSQARVHVPGKTAENIDRREAQRDREDGIERSAPVFEEVPQRDLSQGRHGAPPGA